MSGLIKSNNNNDLGPQNPKKIIKVKKKEYQTYLIATIEHYLNRNLKKNDILLEENITEGIKIKEWNIQEIEQPTTQQIINYWNNNKTEILRRLVLKLFNKKQQFLFLNKLFEQYKNTDTDYLNKKENIQNADLKQLKTYLK